MTRLVAVIPRISIDSRSLMIAESSKAGFLIILISHPESSSRFVLVFKSGETIRAVGVHRELFGFIEIIRRGRCPNLSPIPGNFCLLLRGLPSLSVADSPCFLIVSVQDCVMVLGYCLYVVVSVSRGSLSAFRLLPKASALSLPPELLDGS